MEPPLNCQSCQKGEHEVSLVYRKGGAVVHDHTLLQCDVCERFACADCLGVYDIVSGYDFVCHHCARELDSARLRGGH
jgi:hypothetical protein